MSTESGASAAGSALGVTSPGGARPPRGLRAGTDRATNLSRVALLYTLHGSGVKSGFYGTERDPRPRHGLCSHRVNGFWGVWQNGQGCDILRPEVRSHERDDFSQDQAK